jgi:hypothetical protein
MEPSMKRTLIAAAGFALFAASGLAGAASWSVIVQPGVYGRVAIGGYAEPPQVYAPQPVVAIDNGYGQVVEETVDPAYATDQPPVYLWVPEYQRTHWAQYCREYGAYGVPVYFVDDGWYRANVLRRNWTPEQRSWNQQQWLEQDRIARDRYERDRFEQQRYEQQARDQQRWNDERAWHPYADRRAEQLQPQQPNPAARPQPGQWQPVGDAGRLAGNRPGRGGNGGQQQAQPAAASQARGGGRDAPMQNAGERRGESRGQGDGRGAYEHGRRGDRER